MTNIMASIEGKVAAARKLNHELRLEIIRMTELSASIEKAHAAMIGPQKLEAKSEYAGQGQKLQDREIPEGVKPKLVTNGDE